MVGIDSVVVGVVGGAGPEASNKFCDSLIRYKSSLNDQDNIAFIHFCNPKIPDRTEFILGRGADPVPEIVATGQRLEEAGASFLIIPCNTAHAFLDRIQREISLPIMDMVGLVTRSIKSDVPGIRSVGILATTGGIRTRLFERYLSAEDISAVTPSDSDQEDMVMAAIYGDNGIKAGRKELPKKLLTEAANKLIENGAEAIILGCTEIPLVLDDDDLGVRLYDPVHTAVVQIIKSVESIETAGAGMDALKSLFYEPSRLTKHPIGKA